MIYLFNEFVKEIICEVFTSQDMQEYLCNNIQLLSKWQIIDIINRAFIPLMRKKEMFECLAFYEDGAAIDKALAQLMIKDKTEGLLLLIAYDLIDGVEQRVDELPFYSYEKLNNYVRKNAELIALEDIHAKRPWYVIEKYVENEAGDLEYEYCYYVFDGNIIYYGSNDFRIGNFYGDLNVPVPFQPGDVIQCDGGPVCDNVTSLVLRVGDNLDCCSLVALCQRSDNTLKVEPVKHSNMFYDMDINVLVPPLYSARRIDNAEKKHSALIKISSFINKDEDRGYIVERNVDRKSVDKITDEWFTFLEQDYNNWKHMMKSK